MIRTVLGLAGIACAIAATIVLPRSSLWTRMQPRAGASPTLDKTQATHRPRFACKAQREDQ